jgi:pyruvate-ferredoxin/flavodoxin oxidoreductase
MTLTSQTVAVSNGADHARATGLRTPQMNAKYPGVPAVINGNGAVAYVMGHVCGGVIGYPITPSTEISELYEAFRAGGGCNVWGKHPFFFNPEGEHSAQSGALGAALTGGKYVSNASSSQGILYGLESHYVTVGKKVGGFVLQVAARVVSKHSLNVMAGHDDVYALLGSGYTILFGSDPQEAADLAAIAYKVASLSLIPVANAMDGFATSHMLSEALLPEPELLKEFLGDPEGRIPAPTVAQEMLFGAKGRLFELGAYLKRHEADIPPSNLTQLRAYLADVGEQIEHDNEAQLIAGTINWIPEELRAQWKRQWLNAAEKGTRQRVPALVDPHNPGLTGGVQNQADFQAGAVDHKTHFASEVPRFVRQAMAEYGELTGRVYSPVETFMCDDADYVMVGLGSVTDDAEAVVTHLRAQGKKVGVVSIKLLQPFPEGDLIEALRGKKAVTVLERCDQNNLTTLVTQALFKARENADEVRHPGVPSIDSLPKVTTAIFGLGGHDLQPRHLVAAYANMENERNAPFVYLGSQFFSKDAPPRIAALQARLKEAYPETEFMALETEPNPHLLPDAAFRIRFHSVGGYGTIATGKLLTDILAGVLGLHSKSAPKYGSEKSGAPTNYYITLSPEPIKITNADLEDVEIVVSPDHKVFSHTNPLRGLAPGGTFIMQSTYSPRDAWKELPASARKTIRERKIKLCIVDAFKVAKKHAPTEDFETRMMGIAFIGAVCGHVDRISAGTSEEAVLAKIRQQISKKFGAKGGTIVESNMEVIREGLEATQKVDYDDPAFALEEETASKRNGKTVAISAGMCKTGGPAPQSGFFDRQYYDDAVGDRFKDGTIGESPVLPGAGLFMPPGSAAWKDKGLFRRTVPQFEADLCTGCMECALVCPDGAIPNAVHDIHELLLTAIKQLDVTDQQKELMRSHVVALARTIRETYRQSNKEALRFHEVAAKAVEGLDTDNLALRRGFAQMVEALAVYPVAKTRPFFDAMEKAIPGSGGLYAVGVDPWKCTGCLECIDVCGPHALVERREDSEVSETLKARFDFLSRMPNTPSRFFEGSTKPDGDTKRLMLDRGNYYAMTGGHGACRGCGEVTAIRLIVGANRAIHERRRKDHARELESLIEQLTAKLEHFTPDEHDPERGARIKRTLATLEKRLYYFEGGPSGSGPTAAVIANATGCSSVFASTFPFNPYNDPWVNSLFQDSPALAKGLFEGLTASAVEDFRALRIAKLDLEDHYNPPVHDQYFKYFRWAQFEDEEMALLPTLISMGGDGATYDIGFGALSRLLTTDTPIKIVVLNTGAYSNTGGQASTASFTAQDSDLTRFGATHRGKQEDRKELGLIAAFHPKVYVTQTSTALQGHFMKSLMDFLTYHDSPALLDVYTPCQPEHGIGDAASNRNARLAVESRMSPVFVHDPRRGDALHDWFSLDGNPEPTKDWMTKTIEYVDADGSTKLMEIPLTPAHFAYEEGRFKRQFAALGNEPNQVPIHEFIDLSEQERTGKIPFISATDDDMHLIRLSVSPTVVELVEDRRKSWRMLQSLGGLDLNALGASHRIELEHWRRQYEDSVAQHETSIDSIARAMSELAAASTAPGVLDLTSLMSGPSFSNGPALAAGGQVALAPAPALTNGAAAAFVSITDMEKCTNCKTCYQDMSELFEKTKIVVNGETKEVARVIPGALEKLTVTPELIARANRAAANCDAEIIRCGQ